MGSSFRSLSIYSSLVVVSTIIGYFGVSDADAVLRDDESNGLLLNKPQQSDTHPFRHSPPSSDNGLIVSQGGDNKDAESESVTIDESMWEQLVIRALANPTEWVQLRQALDKVDADLRALTSLENSKRNQSKSAPKWRFTYHRVTSPQFTSRNQTQSSNGNYPVKGKAFAAISLATPDNPDLQTQTQEQEQSNQVTGILPPPMINHKMQEILQSSRLDDSKPDTSSDVRSGFNKQEDKSPWTTSENLSHYHITLKEDEPEKKPEEQEEHPMTKPTSKNQIHSINSFNLGSSSNSINTRNWGWAAKSKSSSSSNSRSRSRTQLEEEIAKMSSSRSNDGSSLSSFHWRPWIRHEDLSSRNDENTIVSSTTTSTTITPSPSHSPSLNDHHKNTWSEELQSYHDQLHATGFSHFHHHHHKNHHRHVSNPSVNAKTAVLSPTSSPPPPPLPEQGSPGNGKDTPVLYSLGDTLRNNDAAGEELVSDQGSSQLLLPTEYNTPRESGGSLKKKRKHRQRHHTHPVPPHLPSSFESSVDPVFSRHRSTQLEYRI